MFKFIQLDPRPTAAASNDALFKGVGSANVLGVEMTLPAYTSRCTLGNLDHHGPADTAETPSACEQALEFQSPYWWVCTDTGTPWSAPFANQEQEGPFPVLLVTVRPDADSVTAMAVIASRYGNPWGEPTPVDEDLVRAVGRFDRLGPSAGVVPPIVSAIARVAADHKRTLADRVAWVQKALAGGSDPVEVAQLIAARDAELAAARAASTVTKHAGGRVVAVVSTHRFATTLGYEEAAVVVALNPTMPVDFADPAKGTYTKYTICRYDAHVPVDLQSALAELQGMEAGWGGRGDIFGSPQGVSSSLTLEQVLAVVERHLK